MKPRSRLLEQVIRRALVLLATRNLHVRYSYAVSSRCEGEMVP
jgi:hypothetical protein